MAGPGPGVKLCDPLLVRMRTLHWSAANLRSVLCPSMDYGESATWVYWLGPKIGTHGWSPVRVLQNTMEHRVTISWIFEWLPKNFHVRWPFGKVKVISRRYTEIYSAMRHVEKWLPMTLLDLVSQMVWLPRRLVLKLREGWVWLGIIFEHASDHADSTYMNIFFRWKTPFHCFAAPHPNTCLIGCVMLSQLGCPPPPPPHMQFTGCVTPQSHQEETFHDILPGMLARRISRQHRLLSTHLFPSATLIYEFLLSTFVLHFPTTLHNHSVQTLQPLSCFMIFWLQTTKNIFVKPS